MTQLNENITPEQAFKSNANFENYLLLNPPEVMTSTLDEFNSLGADLHIVRYELTQKFETFLNSVYEISQKQSNKPSFIVWIIANEKENIMEVLKLINPGAKGFGIFVFKASLKDNKMDIKCLLKPESNFHKPKVGKCNQLQVEYWEKYFEICDEIGSDMQVNPKSQHWQYLPMGKKGVCLMLTISTKLKYIGVDLIINYDKKIYNQLEEYSEELNKEFDGLEWVNIQDNKSAKIRKTLEFDITDKSILEDAIKTHISLAEKFKKVFSKYL